MAIPATVEQINLPLTDHFSPYYSSAASQRVWVIRHRRPIDAVATLFNLGILLGGIDQLHKFEPPGLSSYTFSFGAQPACGAEPSDLQATCERQVSEAHFGKREHAEQIERTGAFYYYAAHATVAGWLALDLARWSGLSSSVLDLVFGFHSAARERARQRFFGLLLLPFSHLLVLYCLPLSAGCCHASPRVGAVFECARALAFLLFVTGFCLLGDSHNHGYLLLRLPDAERSALVLLRAHLERLPGSGTSPPAERETDTLLRQDDEMAKMG